MLYATFQQRGHGKSTRRPADVTHARLVVVDGAPDRAPDVVASLRDSLSKWPIPFPSRAAAESYFGGEPLTARVWADSLDLRRVRQPTLVVGGSRSTVVAASTLERMANEISNGRYVSIEGAGHDVHLDRPDAWRETLEHFLGRGFRLPNTGA